MSSRAAKADIISIFLHWTKYPVHLPLWLANTAHCLMSYIYSADAVDQTLKIKQPTFSFLLPKCNSVNLSGCSPKAIWQEPKAQESKMPCSTQTMSSTFTLSWTDFASTREISNPWLSCPTCCTEPDSPPLAHTPCHKMPFSPRLWNVTLMPLLPRQTPKYGADS